MDHKNEPGPLSDPPYPPFVERFIREVKCIKLNTTKVLLGFFTFVQTSLSRSSISITYANIVHAKQLIFHLIEFI